MLYTGLHGFSGLVADHTAVPSDLHKGITITFGYYFCRPKWTTNTFCFMLLFSHVSDTFNAFPYTSLVPPSVMSEMTDKSFTVYGPYKGHNRLISMIPCKNKRQIIIKIIQGLKRVTLQQSFSRSTSSSSHPLNLAHLPDPNLGSQLC